MFVSFLPHVLQFEGLSAEEAAKAPICMHETELCTGYDRAH